MPDYSTSKIYKIVCRVTNKIYIGSTTQKLNRKLDYHEWYFRRGRLDGVCCVLENGSYYIELIENYPCESRMELNKRENHYLDTEVCVNANRPYVPEPIVIKEPTQAQRYALEHKDRLIVYRQKRYQENKIECDNCGMMINKNASVVKRHKNTKKCKNETVVILDD